MTLKTKKILDVIAWIVGTIALLLALLGIYLSLR